LKTRVKLQKTRIDAGRPSEKRTADAVSAVGDEERGRRASIDINR